MSFSKPENPTKCVQMVYGRRSLVRWQCTRKRVDGKYCKIHSPEGVKARDKAREARFDARFGKKESRDKN